MREHLIYFAARDGLIKIGCSSQPGIRSKQLSAKLLGVMAGDFRKEREIHRKFAKQYCLGEWFDDCEQIRDFVGVNCRDWHPSDDDNPMPGSNVLLSVKDVAKLLKLGTAKVYQMDRNGSGPPSIRLGKLIKFRREAVEEWIKENEG